jgi:hypothetical protein
MRGMLNSANPRPLRLQPILCPLPAALACLAAVAADPGSACQHRALAHSGQQHCVAGLSFPPPFFGAHQTVFMLPLAIRQIENSSKITGSKKKA